MGNQISAELNLAWDAFKSGNFDAANVHANEVLASAYARSDDAVIAQLILIKMKTQHGLFTGMLDELDHLFSRNPKIRGNTQALLANEIVRVAQHSGNVGIGAQRGEEFLREFSKKWPDVEVVELLCQVASCHFLRGDFERAEELVTRALELAEQCKSPKSLAQSYWQLSAFSAGRGNMPMSISQNQEARNWAHLAEMKRTLPILNNNAAALRLELPDPDLSHIHELAEAAYLELSAQNDPSSAAYACVTLSEVELRQANYEEAHMYVDKGLAELPLEIPGPRVSLYIQKAKILVRTGKLVEAEAKANIAIDLMKDLEPSRYLATSWGHLARVLVEAGLPERGAYAYEQALQIAGVVREEVEDKLETEVRSSAQTTVN